MRQVSLGNCCFWQGVNTKLECLQAGTPHSLATAGLLRGTRHGQLAGKCRGVWYLHMNVTMT